MFLAGPEAAGGTQGRSTYPHLVWQNCSVTCIGNMYTKTHTRKQVVKFFTRTQTQSQGRSAHPCGVQQSCFALYCTTKRTQTNARSSVFPPQCCRPLLQLAKWKIILPQVCSVRRRSIWSSPSSCCPLDAAPAGASESTLQLLLRLITDRHPLPSSSSTGGTRQYCNITELHWHGVGACHVLRPGVNPLHGWFKRVSLVAGHPISSEEFQVHHYTFDACRTVAYIWCLCKSWINICNWWRFWALHNSNVDNN